MQIPSDQLNLGVEFKLIIVYLNRKIDNLLTKVWIKCRFKLVIVLPY